MKKEIYANLKKFTFDASRKGAKYSFDEIHWMNNGELCEAQHKHCLGLIGKKDANTPFDVGSDIEELGMSIKSSKATLTSIVLGNDFQSSIDCYFERVASTSWAWDILIDGTLTVYIMNEPEFKEFMIEWANFQQDRKTIRFKATSGKMIAWLEERV